MEQQHTRGNVAYMDRILSRLLEYYLKHAELPGKDEEHVTIALMHRLARCVVAEGYGE